TTESPVIETERRLVIRGTPLISRSIGSVTVRSTSSGAWPGTWVTTWTWTSWTSGKASIGRFVTAFHPKNARATVASSTNTRCCSPNVIRRSSTLLRCRAQLAVEEHRPRDHDAHGRLDPRGDVAVVPVLHRELDAPTLEDAEALLDEHVAVEALGDQRGVGEPHRGAVLVGEQRHARVHLRLELPLRTDERAAHLHAPRRGVDDLADLLDAGRKTIVRPRVDLDGYRLAGRHLGQVALRQIDHHPQPGGVGDDEQRILQVGPDLHSGIELAGRDHAGDGRAHRVPPVLAAFRGEVAEAHRRALGLRLGLPLVGLCRLQILAREHTGVEQRARALERRLLALLVRLGLAQVRDGSSEVGGIEDCEGVAGSDRV